MAKPPSIETSSAKLVQRTDTASGMEIALTLTNPNADEALPLLDVEYRVALNGREVYEGRRSAQATLSPGSQRTLHVPAVFVHDRLHGHAQSGELTRVRIEGRLTYRTAGTMADLLFDLGVRTPKVRFSGEMMLDSAP